MAWEEAGVSFRGKGGAGQGDPPDPRVDECEQSWQALGSRSELELLIPGPGAIQQGDTGLHGTLEKGGGWGYKLRTDWFVYGRRAPGQPFAISKNWQTLGGADSPDV